MGRRNIAGRKAYQTRLDRTRIAENAVLKIAENAEKKANGNYNKYDTADWEITVQPTDRSIPKTKMDFKEAARVLCLWTMTNQYHCAFQICDPGNNFGLNDVIAEILLSGASIHTHKAIFRLTKPKPKRSK